MQLGLRLSLFLIFVCFISSIVSYGQTFNPDQPFSIGNSERSITKQSSIKDTVMCKGWIISREKLPVLISSATLIDGHTWHTDFEVLPCVIIGQLIQNGQAYNFEINAGSWISVFNKDTVIRLGNYRKSHEKFFLVKALKNW